MLPSTNCCKLGKTVLTLEGMAVNWFLPRFNDLQPVSSPLRIPSHLRVFVKAVISPLRPQPYRLNCRM